MNVTDIEKLASEFTGVITHAAQAYGPAAANAAFTVTRITCISNIIMSFLGATAFSVIGVIFAKLSCKWAKEDDDCGGKNVLPGAAAVFCFCPIVLNNLVTLLDVWNWVGAFNPQIYIIHQILEKVAAHQ